MSGHKAEKPLARGSPAPLGNEQDGFGKPGQEFPNTEIESDKKPNINDHKDTEPHSDSTKDQNVDSYLNSITKEHEKKQQILHKAAEKAVSDSKMSSEKASTKFDKYDEQEAPEEIPTKVERESAPAKPTHN